jgi:formylglycine-generating enzyme
MVLVVGLALCLVGCPTKQKQDQLDASATPSGTPPVASVSAGIAMPSSSPPSSASAAPSASVPVSVLEPKGVCPPEMVLVDRGYCVDRWEGILVDKKSMRRLSPYYPVPKRYVSLVRKRWERQRLEVGDAKARAMPLPPVAKWQEEEEPEPMAMSFAAQVPNGYVSGVVAKKACENAGKRLCEYREWVHACMGQEQRQFPYGEEYHTGSCNIYRTTHPASRLHKDPTRGHLDPRLNLVSDKDGTLLRLTGATKTCRSRWNKDAISDMNGNVDEWIAHEKGRFLGGFFSRAKRDGCKSSVSAHPKEYFDYSLGVRCCWSPKDGTPKPHQPPLSKVTN